jgi:hypothetical protein
MQSEISVRSLDAELGRSKKRKGEEGVVANVNNNNSKKKQKNQKGKGSNEKKKCAKCGKTNHTTENCWKGLKCDHCGKEHPSDKCFQKGKDNDKGEDQEVVPPTRKVSVSKLYAEKKPSS